MKVAHFYPAMQVSSSILNNAVFSDQRIQKKLRPASRILDNSPAEVFQKERPFTSLKECFVTTYAATSAVAEYYIRNHSNPQVIIGSCFGHFSGLTMAGSLDYQITLNTVANNGEILDQYFKNKLDSIKAESLGNIYRLPSLTNSSKTIGESIKDNIFNMPIDLPAIPFISTLTFSFVNSVEEIRNVLLNLMGSPHRLLATLLKLRQENIFQIVHMKPSFYNEKPFDRKFNRHYC